MSNKFLDLINKDVLPKIDYKKLGESYTNDFEYAKEVFSILQDSFASVYGHKDLDVLSETIDYIYVPTIIQSRETRGICVGIIALDLMSSGEHCDTYFISEYGVHNQFNGKTEPAKEYVNSFVPYDYYYDATYEGDIHTMNELPPDIKAKFYDEPQAEMSMGELK